MNIKSLLLGSAAALVAVTGARAADAVVIAEPEPMDYVRICDTYGAGFYYIPGTETCLRVGGYVRYDIGVGAFGNQDVFDKEDDEDGFDNLNDTYDKNSRAQVVLDARSETELGTLRSYIELRFNYSVDVDDENFTTTSDSFSVNNAYIELAGFRVGRTDSLFSTFTNFAGGVINDDLVSYGPFGTHQIAYTFTGGNGFSAAVAVEEGSGDDFTLDDYVPHVVAGVGFTQGWGGISAVVGYDSVYEEAAGKVRLDFNASDRLSLFVMGGYKSGADDFDSDGDGDGDTDGLNYYGSWGGDWAVWGGGTFALSEKADINVQLSYSENEDFAAVANVAYELVENFTITPEIAFVDNLDDDNDDDDDGDEIGGFLRFQRNF